MIVNKKNLSFDTVFGLAEDMVYANYLRSVVAKNNEIKEVSQKAYKQGLSKKTKLSNKDLDNYYEKKSVALEKQIDNLVEDYNVILRAVLRNHRIEKENKKLKDCEISTDIDEDCVDYGHSGYYEVYKKLVDMFFSVEEFKRVMKDKTISFDKEEPISVGSLKFVSWQVARDVVFCYGLRKGYLVITDSNKFDYDNKFGRTNNVKGVAFVGRDYPIMDAEIYAKTGIKSKVKETSELE